MRRIGRQDPDRDPQHQPDARRADAERDRDREPARDLLLHRDEVAVRVVHVLGQEQSRPRDEALREPRVLDPHRLVQAERLARVRDLLGRRGLARRTASGIAGRKLHEDDERQQRDDEQDQHHEEGSAYQVPAHGGSVRGVGAGALAVPCRIERTADFGGKNRQGRVRGASASARRPIARPPPPRRPKSTMTPGSTRRDPTPSAPSNSFWATA